MYLRKNQNLFPSKSISFYQLRIKINSVKMKIAMHLVHETRNRGKKLKIDLQWRKRKTGECLHPESAMTFMLILKYSSSRQYLIVLSVSASNMTIEGKKDKHKKKKRIDPSKSLSVSFPSISRACHPSEDSTAYQVSVGRLPFFVCTSVETWDAEMRWEDGRAECLESRAFKRHQSLCSPRRWWEEWPPPPRPRWRFHFNPQHAPLLEARRTRCCRAPATTGRLSLMIFKDDL